MKLIDFIAEKFPGSILEQKEDEGTRFGLPYPFTVPSPGDVFDCMFYWDTYFTNVGLLPDWNLSQAIYNTDNIRHLIERFGYMPNSSKAHHLGQSQPPFYCRMVKEIYDITGDRVWLGKHYDTISKEYDFWMTYRLAPNGLNYYGKDISGESQERISARYNYFLSRFEGFSSQDPEMPRKAAETMGSLCESGWDCCYRFQLSGHSYNPVDLNFLLLSLETNMVFFSKELNRGEEKLWQQRADRRKGLLDRYLYVPEKGFYLDWNFAEQKHSPVISVASLFPLFLGFHHPSENLMKILEEELLLPFGVAATVKTEHPYKLQWEYPNLWAPLQYVAYRACVEAGREDLAKTIAQKYMMLLETNFEKTGNIWEKYDSVTGEVVNAEYHAPPMMGWTAGVYLYFHHQYQN